MKRSTRNIRWLETHCHIPEGKDIGKPLRLRPWQKRDLRKIYDNPWQTRRAILSFGRKNAKSTTAAFLLLLHLAGPEARPNSQLYSAAQSREQASIVFNLAAKIVRMSPELSEYVVIRDSLKQLACPGVGTLYRALSADAPTAFGLSPVFTIHDELGQVRGPRSSLYEALETAASAHENPLSIIISTQAPTDADLLSILLDDALQGTDKRVVLSLYTADPTADPFARATIKQANPAFGDFQNAEEVLAMAEDARRMPSREAEYRNLVLNQRVEAVNPFVSLSVWRDNGAEEAGWGPVYCGLDLSDTSDLTALIMVSPVRQLVSVRCKFWLPDEGLAERARLDRVEYDVWKAQGFLCTTPGRSVEYEYVANEIVQLFDTEDVRKLAFDRWNMKHLKPWLIKAGLSESLIEDRFVDFGQGYQSMSPALRNLESLLLGSKLRHGMHPVLTMCAANSVVRMDESGNRKLDKKRALSLDTALPTPWGWTRMGDVRIGDTLFDENGKPCRVLDKSDVQTGKHCFAVRFSDGEEIIADAGHLWAVHDAKTRAARILTTEGMVSIGLEHAHQRRFQIHLAKPLELPDVDLPLDPYLLGAWLGDGSLGSGCITSMDDDLVRAFEGHFVVIDKGPASPSNKANRYVIEGLTRPLWELGVYGCKFVPDIYLRGSVRQRLALLQGLMDTDGHVSKPRGRNGGVCTFTNTNTEVAEGVHELCASLGLKPVLKLHRKAHPPHKEVHRVQFTAYSDTQVFRLPYKVERMLPPPKRQTRASHRQIIAIEQVPSVPVSCITVDSPSSLFLCGRKMIPTHNSRGRIDGMVALGMACDVAQEDVHEQLIFPVSLDRITEDLHA